MVTSLWSAKVLKNNLPASRSTTWLWANIELTMMVKDKLTSLDKLQWHSLPIISESHSRPRNESTFGVRSNNEIVGEALCAAARSAGPYLRRIGLLRSHRNHFDSPFPRAAANLQRWRAAHHNRRHLYRAEATGRQVWAGAWTSTLQKVKANKWERWAWLQLASAAVRVLESGKWPGQRTSHHRRGGRNQK